MTKKSVVKEEECVDENVGSSNDKASSEVCSSVAFAAKPVIMHEPV